jgi:serine/threonine protein kinase
MIEELSARFDIIEEIGSGGMSVVYKAVNKKTKQTIALKVLKKELLADKAHIRRFEKEARALSGFSHKNIVNVLSAGVAGNVPYIEMELVEGITLKDYIQKNGALDYRQAIDIALQLCKGLDHAHAKRIIHRDIKSQNIMILPDGNVKVADFGIALDVSASTVTFEGKHVMGSVHYFSPEQASGGVVNEQSDIYSLGIVIYEMLTGTVPFTGENSVAVALKHINEEMTPPKALQPDIPQSMNNLVCKATAKTLEHRYRSMKELGGDLARILCDPCDVIDAGENVVVLKVDETDQPKERIAGRIFRVVLLALIVIALFTVMLLIGNALLSSINKEGQAGVPDFRNRPLAEAELLAQKYELTLMPEYVQSEEDADAVVSQNPLPDTPLPGNGRVVVFVSDGLPFRDMPKLEGMTLDQALLELESMGFGEPVVKFEEQEGPKGMVLAQSPAPNTEVVSSDTIVELWVSDETQMSDTVPDVREYEVQTAQNRLEQLGLKVGLVTMVQNAEHKPGTVLETSPAAGEKSNRYGTVELMIAAFEEDYALELPVELEFAEPNSVVVATIEEYEGIEIIQHNQVIQQAGRQKVELLLNSSSEKAKRLRVYINGKEMFTRSVSFQRMQEDVQH